MPNPFSTSNNDLRSFVRSTSMSTTQLAYIPADTSEMVRPSLTSSQSAATLSRSSSSVAHLDRPAPIRRSSSFANLLSIFRRPSLSFSSETLSTRASESNDLHERAKVVAVQSLAGPAKAAVPERSTSLSWEIGASPGAESSSVSTIARDVDGEPELEVAAELEQTFRSWEEKYGMKRRVQDTPTTDEHMSPIIYTSPPSPTCSQLLTPGPSLPDTLSPLRSEFSCDSDDAERATILDLIRSRDLHKATPGSIGRLTRKMSSAIALSIAQRGPLGRRMGLGERRESA